MGSGTELDGSVSAAVGKSYNYWDDLEVFFMLGVVLISLPSEHAAKDHPS